MNNNQIKTIQHGQMDWYSAIYTVKLVFFGFQWKPDQLGDCQQKDWLTHDTETLTVEQPRSAHTRSTYRNCF